MPYQDPVPGGYWETRRYLEDRDLDRQSVQLDNRYKLALMEQAMRDAEAAQLVAPYEAQKAQLGLAETAGKVREQELKNASGQRDYLLQSMGPVVAAHARGQISDEQFSMMARQAEESAPFEISDQQREMLRRAGPREWGIMVQQALSVKDQMKPPPAPISAQQGAQNVYLDPYTRQPIPGLGGPKFAPSKPKVDFFRNDRGKPTGVGTVAPDGSWTVQEFPGDEGGSDTGADDSGLPQIPAGQIDEITSHLGPWSKVKEVLSQRVLPVAGVTWTNAERDQARTRMRTVRANLADLIRIEGGRSNAFLSLALAAIPDDALENPKRASNAMNEMLEQLKKAYERDMQVYNSRNTPKRSADIAYERALGIKSVFDVLASPMGAQGDEQAPPGELIGHTKSGKRVYQTPDGPVVEE